MVQHRSHPAIRSVERERMHGHAQSHARNCLDCGQWCRGDRPVAPTFAIMHVVARWPVAPTFAVTRTIAQRPETCIRRRHNGRIQIRHRETNLLRAAPGTPVWQRNYCEHVDRNERELTAIREYILAIPPGGTTTKTTRATNRIWPQPCIEPLDSGGQHLDSHLQESIMVASRPVRTTKKPVTRSVK